MHGASTDYPINRLPAAIRQPVKGLIPAGLLAIIIGVPLAFFFFVPTLYKLVIVGLITAYFILWTLGAHYERNS